MLQLSDVSYHVYNSHTSKEGFIRNVLLTVSHSWGMKAQIIAFAGKLHIAGVDELFFLFC